MSSFLQRAVITFTLGPIAVLFIYLGGFYYTVPLLIILALATLEFVQLSQGFSWRASQWILVPLVLANLVNGQWPEWNLAGPTLLLSLLVVLAYALWLYESQDDKRAPVGWMVTSAAVVLLGWLGSHFFLLRGLDSMAWQWTMLAMGSTWIADSAAYVVGRFLAGRVLGKHALSPRLSPNKTVEGYAGGIVIGTSLTVLLAYWLQLPVLTALVLGLLVSVVSPLGDLGISLLKREAGVKDSGTVFRGHGGALDRIDSLVWSVAMAYYLVVLST